MTVTTPTLTSTPAATRIVTTAVPYRTFGTVSVRGDQARHRSPLCFRLWTDDRAPARRWLGSTMLLDDDQLADWPVCEDCAATAGITEHEFTQAWHAREFRDLLG